MRRIALALPLQSLLMSGVLSAQAPTGQGCAEPPPIDTQHYAIRDIFYLGEKATSAPEGEVPACPVRVIPYGRIANVFSILDLYLRNNPSLIDSMRARGYNVLLVPEIRRAGESAWQRIEAPNRLYRRIVPLASDSQPPVGGSRQPPSADGAMHPTSAGTQQSPVGGSMSAVIVTSPPRSATVSSVGDSTGGCKPGYSPDTGAQGLGPRTTEATFSLDSLTLGRSVYLREGDRVPVLEFFDLVQRYNCPYLRDLRDAARQRRAVLTLDLQQLPLISTGSAPFLYQAHDGDRIRIRILGAEQDIRQRDRALELLSMGTFPDSTSLRATQYVSLLDEIDIDLEAHGWALHVLPSIAYGSRSPGFSRDRFNPISVPFAPSNLFYLSYRGSRRGVPLLDWIPAVGWLTRQIPWQAANYLPGVFMALMPLDSASKSKFTLGLAWSPPFLREWLNVFYGWNDLHTKMIGIAVSPRVDIKALLSKEGTQAQ